VDGIALKPLMISFSEPGFLSKANQENQFGPWFTLSNKERQQLGSPMGPANPQALNRDAYVLNNPVRNTDPSGHCSAERTMYNPKCSGQTYFRGRSGFNDPVHPDVQRFLDEVPEDVRPGYHGRCAEIHWINQAAWQVILFKGQPFLLHMFGGEFTSIYGIWYPERTLLFLHI
jgi:hypothetical protein